MNKILIIIDAQNDFVTGSLGSAEAILTVPKIVQKCREFRKIYFTRDSHTNKYAKTQEGKKLPIVHCQINSYGWEIIDDLIPFYEEQLTFNKDTFGFEYWRDMLRYEGYIDEIHLCGFTTDICVITNALILKMLFPEVHIVVDAQCCAGTSIENHKQALNIMKSCQIEVKNYE